MKTEYVSAYLDHLNLFFNQCFVDFHVYSIDCILYIHIYSHKFCET